MEQRWDQSRREALIKSMAVEPEREAPEKRPDLIVENPAFHSTGGSVAAAIARSPRRDAAAAFESNKLASKD